MSNPIHNHLRTNFVGYIALFLALTGVTYAAGLKANSVRSKQIANGQVKSADLAAGSVTGFSVAPNTLGGDQVDESALAVVPSAREADRATNAEQLGGQDPAAFQQRVSGACSGGQAVQSVAADGQVACGAPAGSGTVTQVGSGTGLSGGPITSSGTLALASSFRLPQSCASGQVAKSNGAGTWNCAADTAGGTPSGAASGDLTGTYPSPAIAGNAVNSAKVADNSLTGADINESMLAKVPSSQNADTVDGREAADLGSARIHATADQAGATLFPGLSYGISCGPSNIGIDFFVPAPGTADTMIVASGIEPGVGGGDVNVANGAQVTRSATTPVSGSNRFHVVASDPTGNALAESQIIIDSGGETYSIAVHLFHVAGATPSCEAFGTATLAE